MEKKYEKNGYSRTAHSPAECVQLEHAGWREMTDAVVPVEVSPADPRDLDGDELADESDDEKGRGER